MYNTHRNEGFAEMSFQLRHFKIRWSIIDFLNNNLGSSTAFDAINTFVLHIRTCCWYAFVKTNGIFSITTSLVAIMRTLVSFGQWRTNVAISGNTFTNASSGETIMHFQIKLSCTFFLKSYDESVTGLGSPYQFQSNNFLKFPQPKSPSTLKKPIWLWRLHNFPHLWKIRKPYCGTDPK